MLTLTLTIPMLMLMLTLMILMLMLMLALMVVLMLELKLMSTMTPVQTPALPQPRRTPRAREGRCWTPIGARNACAPWQAQR
jgi:hypothetical protein